MHTVEQVILAAKALPASDQWRVWDELAHSLEPEGDDPAEMAEVWRQEVTRRSDEVDAGTGRFTDGDGVLHKARAIAGLPTDG